MKGWKTCLAGSVVLLLVPGFAFSQARMESPKDFDVGDKITFAWELGGKKQTIEEEVVSVSGGETRLVQKVGDKTFEGVVKSGAEVHKIMCLSNGQQCNFSTPLRFADYPLEKGKKWTTTFTVEGENFKSEVTQERKVDKIEKVKTPAGEFEAFKVTYSGRIRGTDSKGASFSGKEEGSDWISQVNGKVVVVRINYRNSFGERASRDLVSVEFR